jgi:hypothetical protein
MNTLQMLFKKVLERLPKTEMWYITLLIIMISISGFVLKVHDRLLQIGFNRNEILTGFIIIAILLSYLITKLITGKKFILAFGAYWDGKYNPYCTIHKTPLASVRSGISETRKLICPKCKVEFELINENNEIMNLRKAKEELRKYKSLN